jgi:hypothetical protein
MILGIRNKSRGEKSCFGVRFVVDLEALIVPLLA